MSLLKAVLLGVIQGFTEFLPVSSSGHLVISQQLLGLQESGAELLSFDLALHFGTLLAVLAVFYRDVWQMIVGTLKVLKRPTPAAIRAEPGAYLGSLVILGTVPAAVIGLSFKDFFEQLFTSAFAAGCMLLVTGVILFATRFVKQSKRELKDLCIADALLVGLSQAFAIFPGISRSGATIATALFSRWDRELAARYSFLLAIPAIVGGIVFDLDSMAALSQQALLPLLAGVLAAAISGFVAIHWLLRVVRKGQLSWFAYYCWAVGGFTMIWFW